jgi:hypothetical protein
MSDFIFLSLLELLVVVFFAVHLEHDINVISCDQESFSVVLGHSLLNFIVNDDFFVVSLVVLSIG